MKQTHTAEEKGKLSFPVIFVQTLILFLGLFGMLGCVVTGFSLSVSLPVLTAAVFAESVLLAVSFSIPRIGWIFPLLLFVGASFTVSRFLEFVLDGIGLTAAAVLQIICLGYEMHGVFMPPRLLAYETRISQVLPDSAEAGEIAFSETIFFLLLSVYLALLLGYLYCSRRWTIGAAAVAVPFFVLCFLMIDVTLPALLPLASLLLFWMLLLLTGRTLQIYPALAARQVLTLLLPACFLLGGLYMGFPREGFVKGSFSERLRGGYDQVTDTLLSIGDTISMHFRNFGFDNAVFGSTVEGGSIDLSDLDSRTGFERTMLKVQSDQPGLVYLRENSYADYSGTGWSNTSVLPPEVYEDGKEQPHFPVFFTGSSILQKNGMEIQELRLKDVHSGKIFLPYYPCPPKFYFRTEGDRCIRNEDRRTEYKIQYCVFPGSFSQLTADTTTEVILNGLYEIRFRRHGMYTTPPESPVISEIIAREELDAGPRQMWETVNRILLFVRGTAAYQLHARQMPEDETDFVSWFLTEAEEGYCVHFASSAVLLLRACGIPARLAVGYLVKLDGGEQWQSVCNTEAHAWAEVFDARLGWIPVEATPASGIRRLTETDESTDTAPADLQGIESDSFAETAAEPETSEPGTDAPSGSETVTETDAEPAKSSGTVLPGGEGTGSIESGTASRIKWRRLLLYLLLFLMCTGGLLSVFPIRRRIRIKRLMALTQMIPGSEERNRDALLLYAQCIRIGRRAAHPLPKALDTLAEKAKFSQHTLSAEEYTRMQTWYQEEAEALRVSRKTLWNRFLDRFISVFY